MQVEECTVVQSSGNSIRVERPEKDGLVSGEIPIFKGMNVPSVGATVICIFSAKKDFLLGELE